MECTFLLSLENVVICQLVVTMFSHHEPALVVFPKNIDLLSVQGTVWEMQFGAKLQFRDPFLGQLSSLWDPGSEGVK